MLTPCPRSADKTYNLHFVVAHVAGTDEHESSEPHGGSSLCQTPLRFLTPFSEQQNPCMHVDAETSQSAMHYIRNQVSHLG